MASRTKVLETLIEYFKEKGRVLKSQESSRETDTPIRIQQIRNIFGSWNRMEKLIMAREQRGAPEATTDVNEVIAAREAGLYEAQKQWKEASENQDKKAEREAEAQVVAEELAANAATPEGANANKMAIGGPLPQEQPDYTKMGATVKTDPVTKEQTVVNVQPKIETVTEEVEGLGKTPAELRDAAKAATADVKVGHATDGGSTGSASIATAAALGGTSSEAKAPAKTST